jgi:hypothetical protein
MAGGINRNQGKDLGSQTVSRQDRNTFLSDGGLWAWNSGTSVLTWSGTINVTVGGLGTFTIPAGGVPNITTAGDGVYLVIDRSAAGVATLVKEDLSAVSNDDDDRLYLGARGADDRFYLIDGTVITTGESKTLGTLVSETDRVYLAGNGVSTTYSTLPMEYIVGSNQLAVFVVSLGTNGGGVLRGQISPPGPFDYDEVGAPGSLSSSINCQASFAGVGETIIFYNVVGGQGPPGVATLQAAYDGGHTVDTQVGPAVVLVNTVSPGWPGAADELQIGQNPADINFTVAASGLVTLAETPAVGAGWGIKVVGDDLIMYNKVTNVAIMFSGGTGVYGVGVTGISFGLISGASFIPSTPAPLRWTEYTGTFTLFTPTLVVTGIATAIKGVVVQANDGARNILWSNINGSGTHNLHITEVGGTVTMSSDVLGTVVVGTSLQGQSYILTVFHV